jgi:hypothetical protein
MIIADGQAVMNEINGQAVSPRFLYSPRLNTTSTQMAHVVDLYMTIVRLVDSTADGFSEDTDSKDLSQSVTPPPVRTRPRGGPHLGRGASEPDVGFTPIDVPTIHLPPRLFNFSQWYAGDGTRATIRDSSYKLNYDDDPAVPDYTLYAYSGGEIPNREDDGTAIDVFNDALTGVNADAQTHLNLLLDELIANYQRDETNPFPDPR